MEPKNDLLIAAFQAASIAVRESFPKEADPLSSRMLEQIFTLTNIYYPFLQGTVINFREGDTQLSVQLGKSNVVTNLSPAAETAPEKVLPERIEHEGATYIKETEKKPEQSAVDGIGEH